MSQQSALAAKAANSVLGCFNRSIAGRLRDLIMSLFLGLVRLDQEQCLQLWSSQYKTATETVEQVEQTHQDNSEAAALIYKKLRELSLHSLENSR